MVIPGKLLKILKTAIKSKKYLVMVYWIDKQNKLGSGFKALNFPLAVADRAFKTGEELFWSKNKKEPTAVVDKSGRMPLYQAGKTEVIKK